LAGSAPQAVGGRSKPGHDKWAMAGAAQLNLAPMGVPG
jgi:hypothetical protein